MSPSNVSPVLERPSTVEPESVERPGTMGCESRIDRRVAFAFVVAGLLLYAPYAVATYALLRFIF